MARLRAGMWSAAALLVLVAGCSRDRLGVPNWRVGQWVSYSVNCGKDRWRLEYAVVGRERGTRPGLYWLEARRYEGRDSVFVKCLVLPGLEGSPEKVLMCGKGMKGQLVVDGRDLGSWFSGGLPGSKVLGSPLAETIDTPAGRFPTVRYRHQSGAVWLSPKVPVFGVVKLKSGEVEMVLADCGMKGAASMIKGVPPFAAAP